MKRLQHPHKSAVNWLIYDLTDEHMFRVIPLLTGNLYDLGCGERPYEFFFLEYCHTYTGVDWGGTVHELKADLVADLNKALPIPSDSADTVVSLSVLEHLSAPDVMLGEAFRILKPQGSLIMEVPFMWHVHEVPYDYARFTNFGLEHMLRKAGFIDIDIRPYSGVWVTLALKFNYQVARLIRGGSWSRRCILLALTPLLWITQSLGLWLDRIWPHSENETAGYFLTGRKPSV